jgi:hypothetical protein
MAEYRYRTEAGGPERIHICIAMFPRSIRVTFDGAEVLAFASRAEYVAGKSATLPDQSTLQVALGQKGLPIVQLHGATLAESGFYAIAGASGVFYFIGGLTTALGVLSSALDIKFLTDLGMSWLSAIQGLLFLLFGFLTRKYQSRIPIGIGMALFTLDALLMAYASIAAGNFPIGGFVMKGFLLHALFQGFQAAGAKRR